MITSIRTFIGSKDFNLSKRFYLAIGFEIVDISPDLSYVRIKQDIGFYLQNYYNKTWCHNTMLFLERDDAEMYRDELLSSDFLKEFPTSKISDIRKEDWGIEWFLHDPAGILWHIGYFYPDKT